MKRRIIAPLVALAASLVLGAPLTQAAALPQLYVYEGGCNSNTLGALAQFEAFVGRNVDGVDDFLNYLSNWSTVVGAATSAVPCWAGNVANLAIAVPLSVQTYTPTAGSTQLKDIANGVLDSNFQTIGQALKTSFPNAQIRLGWEENGNWEPWSAYQDEADWQAAFRHVSQLLKGISPGFTIWFNPSIRSYKTDGVTTDAGTDFPGLGSEDGMAWDVYAAANGNLQTEPTLYEDLFTDNTGWGMNRIGSFESGLPTAIPEFGVGSDLQTNTSGNLYGNGACSGTGVNSCDDAYFMTQALSRFVQVGAKFVGYWDYDQGPYSNDYNSKISDGSRPHEALAFLQFYGSPNEKAIFNIGAAPFTTTTAPTLTTTNCHAIAFQNAPNQYMVVVWAQSAHPSVSVSWGTALNATLYDPTIGPSSAVPLGVTSSWPGSLSAGQSYVIAIGTGG